MIKKVFMVLAVALFSFSAEAAVFTVQPVPDPVKQEIINKKTWKEGCPVPIDRLSLVKVSYFDFEGKEHDDGEIVVMDAAAEYVKNIFQRLYEKKFPIEKIKRIESYNGDDELSMTENNTSAFNCRLVAGGGPISIHAYGLALDINTVQNPYVEINEKDGKVDVYPKRGVLYLNRTKSLPGMIEHLAKLFIDNGFSIWGGTWQTPLDWQHFQSSRAVSNILAAMTTVHAKEFFRIYIVHHGMLNNATAEETTQFIDLYKKTPDAFIKVFKRYSHRLDHMGSPEALKLIEEKSL